jgi:hypothetical protein
MSTFPCPQCQNPIDPPPGAAGVYVLCPHCAFHVPVPSGTPSEFTADFAAPPTDAFVEIPADQPDPALLAELPDPLPADIAALGPPLAVFRYRGGISRHRLILGGLMLAIGLNSGIYQLISYFGGARWMFHGIIPFHVAAVFWGVCGALLVERELLLLTRKVFVFPGGFVHYRWPHFDACPWNQVRRAGRYQTWPWRKWGYIVERDGGRVFQLDDRLDRLDELGRIILLQTTTHLLKRALADHDAGRPVHFNGFKVSQTGVSRGRDCLAWQRIRVAQRLKTRVWVWQWDQEKPWAQVDADELAHADVFVGLVNTVLAERRDSPR